MRDSIIVRIAGRDDQNADKGLNKSAIKGAVKGAINGVVKGAVNGAGNGVGKGAGKGADNGVGKGAGNGVGNSAGKNIKEVRVRQGTSLWQLADKYYESEDGFFPVLASVNDEPYDMAYCLSESCTVEFMDLRSRGAELVYQRSLYFLCCAALHELLPECTPVLMHPLNQGIYVYLGESVEFDANWSHKLEVRMREMVDAKTPFEKRVVRRKEILSDNPPEGISAEQIDFIRTSYVREVYLYTCGGFTMLFYDFLTESARSLSLFDIVSYEGGFVLRTPQDGILENFEMYRDDINLYHAFREHSARNEVFGVMYVKDLNRKIREGEWRDLILLNEALQEKKIATIADDIISKNKRIILVTGPSSSGKTTFAQRLCIHLRVNGKRPLYMGTDDYFVERDNIPLNEKGERAIEDFIALDADLFNNQMNDLLSGLTVDMPVYDFMTGSKRYGQRITKAESDQPIVIEGIHALNPKLTDHIDDELKYRIYVSPLTTLNIDENNRIPLTDIRFARRIARDVRSRGVSPSETLRHWCNVREGETRNVFPFSNEADVVFNSVFMYEWAILKYLINDTLENIREEDPGYMEAQRLIRIFRCVEPLKDTDEIGRNSIMREFLGGGIWVK